MNPSLQLETERLILRPMAGADLDAVAASAADPETMRFLGSPPMNRNGAFRVLCMVLGHWQLRGYGFFSCFLRENGSWVGRVGPWFPEMWPAPEVGWLIARPYWGRGYATEAAAACVAYCFEELGWDRVTHCIDPGNTASRRVAEKLGSRILQRGVRLPVDDYESVDLWGQDRPA